MARSLFSFSLLSLFSIFILFGCGGGGGSNDFPGVYRVNLNLISDNCGFQRSQTLSATQTVNQEDDRIVLNSGGAVFVGKVRDDNDGFTVINESQAGNCFILAGFGYRFSNSSDSDFRVSFLQEQACGSARCETIYSGFARRVK
jgi:hypothetical protein